MTQASTLSDFQNGVRESESEHRGDPRGWAGASTHALADRPRMLRHGEREPSWQVVTFDADVPRSVILEAAGDARDDLGHRDDELVFFLVDLPGPCLQLRVRGWVASGRVARAILDRLRETWPEVVRC